MGVSVKSRCRCRWTKAAAGAPMLAIKIVLWGVGLTSYGASISRPGLPPGPGAGTAYTGNTAACAFPCMAGAAGSEETDARRATARVHHTARRRGGVATGGAGATI